MVDKIVRIKLEGGSAISDANRTNRAVKGVGTSADKVNDSLGRMSRIASAVITALATNQVVKYADSWTTVNNRLAQATKTAREFNTAQQGVIAIAQRASTDIEGVATAYSRLSQATTDLNLSQDQLLDVTNKLTLALKAGGATAEETSSVMIQLAQGLGSGALQGDELRSILESSIPISKALAKEFNTNVGSLKTLGAQGLITADRVINALEGMDESALTFTKTFSDGLTNVNNALTVYVGGINESLGATKFAGEALNSFAENINVITDAVIALAALFGARLVGAVAASTASMIAYTRASLAATVQTNALGQVVARNTVLMNAQALAARGAGAAFALIGGPAGAAFLAAAAIIYFITQAEDAESRSKALAQEVDNLKASYVELNQAQRQIQITNLTLEYKQLQAELIAANEKLNTFKKFSDSPVKTENVRKYTAEVERLSRELDTISIKQQAVFQAGIDNISFTDATNERSSTNASGGGEFPVSGGEDITAKLERENQMIQQSLLNRQNIYSNFFAAANDLTATEYERQQAQLSLNLATEMQRENEAFQARLQAITDRQLAIAENKSLNDEQKREADALLNEQAILARQQFENRITEISQEGAARRAQIDQQEAINKINTYQGYANTALSLATAFGSKSEKQNKKNRKNAVKIDTAAGIARAFAENDFYTALGISGLIAANGIKQIKAIDSAGQPSANLASGATSPQPSQSSNASSQQQARRIVDLRGFGDGGFLTKEQLTALLEGDEDVILANNNGQAQGSRVGLI